MTYYNGHSHPLDGARAQNYSTVQRPAWAGNGYTLPQHAFIPHPSTRQLQTGHVTDPVISGGMIPAQRISNAPNVTGSPTNIHTYTFLA